MKMLSTIDSSAITAGNLTKLLRKKTYVFLYFVESGATKHSDTRNVAWASIWLFVDHNFGKGNFQPTP